MNFVEIATNEDFLEADNRVINKWMLSLNLVANGRLSYDMRSKMVTISFTNVINNVDFQLLVEKIADSRKVPKSEVFVSYDQW